MKQITFSLLASVITVLAWTSPAPRRADGNSAPVYVTEIPSGYRDWRLISLAHEEGSLHSFAAVLGNDVAIKACREGTLPFPGGAVIASLHFKVFGRAQSFVPGAPTNIQFMVKDSMKDAKTGGWGFGHFKDGKPADGAFMKTCFSCHEKATGSDLVFTHYAP
jgi:Cytochrome P460